MDDVPEAARRRLQAPPLSISCTLAGSQRPTRRLTAVVGLATMPLVSGVLMMLFLAFLLLATLGLGVPTAMAACGGGPCSCGSVVDTDTTLNELVDPVCSTDPTDTCPGTGLFVNAGIVLNLGGCTLRGVAVPFAAGVDAAAGAQVLGGRISGFRFYGVSISGDGGKVSNLQISDIGFYGVYVIGNSNRVEKAIVRRSYIGVLVAGDDNVVSGVQELENGRGVDMEGNDNIVEKSNAFRNT